MGKAYMHCLQMHEPKFMTTTCHSMNPHYCGRWFGKHADVRHLTDCRQLLYSNETATNYTSVPPPITKKTRRYRSCLATIRKKVYSQFLQGYFSAVL